MGKRKFVSNEAVSDVYVVETIYKKKMRNNKEPLYYIKWKDWDEKYNSWEPLSNILDLSLIETFEDEIRQKQKLRKDTSKNKIFDVDKVDYESDVKSEAENDTEPLMKKKLEDDLQEKEILERELLSSESINRPKICIKIPKYRIQSPNTSLVTNSLKSDNSSHEIETPQHSQNQSEDDWKRLSRLSPTNMPTSDDLDKVIKMESPHHRKSPKKLEANQSFFCTNEAQTMKPRKLLSINEYSAVIKMKKKHHKKSKQSKHRSENRVSQISKDTKKQETIPERQEPSKSESERTPKEIPLLSSDNSSGKWPTSRHGGSLLQEIANKLENHKYKFHAQTVLTDVTICGLCVTIKEMSYDDFISDSHKRYQMVRVPQDSDWEERLLNKSCEKRETDSPPIDSSQSDSAQSDDDDVLIIEEDNYIDGEVNKQRLLGRLEERSLQCRRPPSRPRSVDSYKNIMDKTMYGLGRQNFTESLTARKITAEVEPVISSGKSPLNIVVDECEDVDVVGGVESENSGMSSLQSMRTSVTTQMRQARLSNQSPISNIIESMLQSYNYSSPMTMPPLQAAPWVQLQEDDPNQFIQLPRANSHQCLSRTSSLDQDLLKYAQQMSFPYFQHPSNILTNMYSTNGQEAPIDLSFK